MGLREPTGRLDELEAKLRAATAARNRIVETARKMIQQANHEYDQTAVPLARQIERLRQQEETRKQIDALSRAALTPASKIVQARPRRPVERLTITLEDGYTQDEVDHYQELLRRKTA